MARPITLLIQRKTKVPTKHQYVHLYRSDWRKVGKIDYEMSKQLFKEISPNGIFETDSQFAKWLYDNFGLGVYFISAWRKGYKGFWSFMKIRLIENGYQRLKKNPTIQEKELFKEKEELENMKKRSPYVEESEKKEHQEDIEMQEENVNDLQSEMKGNKKRGCYPYLKSVQPVYSFHSYEDYGYSENQEEEIGSLF